MKALTRNVPLTATIVVFFLMCIVCSLRYEPFLQADTFRNLLSDNAFVGIAAVGATFVILSGGIDLSVGSVIAFTSIFVATLTHEKHFNPFVAIGIGLAVGTLFGAFLGFIIGKFNLPPFLVTLAAMFLARGIGLVISVRTITLDEPLYQTMGDQKWALPAMFLVMLAVGMVILHLRPFGRNVASVGGNETSALLMGLPVLRTKICIYAFAGFCSALAGVANGFYTASGNASIGVGLELDVIASVVIGGTLLSGGVGSLVGTLFGVLVLGVIQTAITLQGDLSSYWTRIVVGLLLMVFILMQRLVQGRAAGAETD